MVCTITVMLVVGAVVQMQTFYASDKQLIIRAKNSEFTQFTYRVVQGNTEKMYADEASVVREHPGLFTQTLYEAQHITKQMAGLNQKLLSDVQASHAHANAVLAEVKEAQKQLKDALTVNPTLKTKLAYYERLVTNGLRLFDVSIAVTALYMTYRMYETQGIDIVQHIFTNL